MPPGLNQRLIAAIAVFLVVAGLIGYFIYDQMEQNDALQADIDRVSAEIADLDKVIATRKEKQDLRDAQEQVFKQLVEILPQYSEKQDESVLEAVTQCGASSKLTFGGVIIDPSRVAGAAPGAPPQGPQPGKPAGPSGQDFAQTGLTIRFTGTYFNFLKFLNLVENRESFLRVDQVTLTPIGATPGQPGDAGASADQKLLSIQVKVSTFAFVPR